MDSTEHSKAQGQLAVVAACLLVAAYLPRWHKLWFVAESGHYGGGNLLLLLLLVGLFRRWRPALPLTYGYLMLQLVVAGYILPHNLQDGGPVFGFVLISGLHILAGLILYFSPVINAYFRRDPTHT
jgi:hypothetical protein